MGKITGTFGIYKGFTAELKDIHTRLKVLWQGPSLFNPQSRFPDHLAESTGRDCIDSAQLSPQRTPLRIGDNGIGTNDHLLQKPGTNPYGLNHQQWRNNRPR